MTVGEPTQEETLEMLFGLRDKYEAHHKVTITDDALHAAVSMSARYINDRFLPDKAIDLIDEAAAHVRIHSFTQPAELKECQSELDRLTTEKSTLDRVLTLKRPPRCATRKSACTCRWRKCAASGSTTSRNTRK